MHRHKTYRRYKGKRQALFGGYVSWDGRQKDSWGYPVRRHCEVRIWMDLPLAYDGCGADTDKLVRALEDKLKRARRFKTDRHVECRECWQY